MAVLTVAALMAATAAADARLRVSAVADALLPATVAVVVAIQRQAAGRMEADRRTVAVEAADMGGNTTLDSFSA